MIQLPHLETNVTVACQHRCVGCNHFTPLQVHRFKESMIRPAVLERDLRNLGRLAHADGWGALGGEPLLHPDIIDLLWVARRSNVADRIEVWTNGIAVLDVANLRFWHAIDTLVLSVYPGFDDKAITEIRYQAEGYGKEVIVKDERTTPNFTRLLVSETTLTDTARRYAECWFRTYSRVIDNGVFYRCCTSPFIAPLLLDLPWGSDGLAIDEETTEGALQAFLDEERPMASCAVCAGRATAEATHVPWREVIDPSAWIVASGGALQ